MSWDSLPIFRDNDLYVDFNMVAGNIPGDCLKAVSFYSFRGASARLSIGCAGTCVSYTRAIHNPYGVIHYITHVCGRPQARPHT